MLSEIHLDKVFCTGVNFEFPEDRRVGGSMGGSFNVDFQSIDLEANKLYANSDDAVKVIELTANPVMTGYDNEDKTETFKLALEIKMFFRYRNTLTLDAFFLNENIWYFKNLVCIYYKQFAEDIIKNSPLKNIEIPPKPDSED